MPRTWFGFNVTQLKVGSLYLVVNVFLMVIISLFNIGGGGGGIIIAPGGGGGGGGITGDIDGGRDEGGGGGGGGEMEDVGEVHS